MPLIRILQKIIVFLYDSISIVFSLGILGAVFLIELFGIVLILIVSIGAKLSNYNNREFKNKSA